MMFNAYLSHNLCAHILHTDLQGKFWLHIDYKHANVCNIVRVIELQTIITHLTDWVEIFFFFFLSSLFLKFSKVQTI